MTDFTDSAQSKQIDQVEHLTDASAKRVVLRAFDADTGSYVNIGASDNGDGTFGVKTTDSALAVNIDDTTTSNVTYIGKAPIASATSAAVWQIAKLNTASGVIKTWADGNGSFDNIWDNRASLSYS